jgi:hemoglobin
LADEHYVEHFPGFVAHGDANRVRGLRRVSEGSGGDTLFQRVGGRDFFVGLVDRFYAGVTNDPILRPMYDEDLSPAKHRLVAFLSQYFGGSTEYEDLRGPPMLRARHLRFKIDEAARDSWLEHMADALEVAEIGAADRDELWHYFVTAANFFMNQGGLSFSGR